MANTYLSKTLGTPTNNIKWTWSTWIKRSKITGSQQRMFFAVNGSNYTTIQFDDEQYLIWFNEIGGTDMQLKTSRQFRDTNAWMNLVFVYDSANATAADRQIIYVNGERQTAFLDENTAGSSVTTAINQAVVHNIASGPGAANFYEGSMSHIHFIDGTAYPATAFGSVDSTSGIWKINTSPSVTYGNNGFFILKDGNTITDSSPNSNNFSLGGGTLTNTEDCPSNNFITLNPLNAFYTNSTFSNGNTTFASGSSYSGTTANILLSTGKWYWEGKPISKDGDGDNYVFGIQGQDSTATNQFVGSQSTGYQIYGANGNLYNNNSGATYAAAFTAGDIIGVALDCTNNKLYFSKNGAWSTGSGAWGSTTFNASTGAKTITAPASVTLGGYYPSQTFWTGNSGTFSMNFGNGYFGTTAVTTNSGNGYAGTDGKSIFNYQPPTGYSALSTKGLNL